MKRHRISDKLPEFTLCGLHVLTVRITKGTPETAVSCETCLRLEGAMNRRLFQKLDRKQHGEFTR